MYKTRLSCVTRKINMDKTYLLLCASCKVTKTKYKCVDFTRLHAIFVLHMLKIMLVTMKRRKRLAFVKIIVAQPKKNLRGKCKRHYFRCLVVTIDKIRRENEFYHHNHHEHSRLHSQQQMKITTGIGDDNPPIIPEKKVIAMSTTDNGDEEPPIITTVHAHTSRSLNTKEETRIDEEMQSVETYVATGESARKEIFDNFKKVVPGLQPKGIRNFYYCSERNCKDICSKVSDEMTKNNKFEHD